MGWQSQLSAVCAALHPTHPQECGWPESGGLGPSPLPTTSQYGALASWDLAVHPQSATVVATPCVPREGARSPSPCLIDGKRRALWQVGDLARAEKSLPTRDRETRPSGLSPSFPNQAAWAHTLRGERWPARYQASV